MSWLDLAKDEGLDKYIKTYPTKAEAMKAPAQILMVSGLEGIGVLGTHAVSNKPPYSHVIVLDADLPPKEMETTLGHEIAHEELNQTWAWASPDPHSKILVELPAILRYVQRFGKWDSKDAKSVRNYLQGLPSEDHRLLSVRAAIEQVGFRGKIPWIYMDMNGNLRYTWLRSSTLMDDEKYEQWLMKPKGGKVSRPTRVIRAVGPGHGIREHLYEEGDPVFPLYHPRYQEEAVLSRLAGERHRFNKGEISEERFKRSKESAMERLDETGDARERAQMKGGDFSAFVAWDNARRLRSMGRED